MLILAFLDAIYKPMPISAKAHHGHILSAGFGILLLSIIGIGLFSGNRIAPLGWIGLYSLIVPVIYFVAMRLLFVYEKRRIAEFVKERVEELRYEKISTKTAVVQLCNQCDGCYCCRNFSSEDRRRNCRNNRTWADICRKHFYSAFHIASGGGSFHFSGKNGAIDLAAGNLFGSNIFNIFILALDDMFL